MSDVNYQKLTHVCEIRQSVMYLALYGLINFKESTLGYIDVDITWTLLKDK